MRRLIYLAAFQLAEGETVNSASMRIFAGRRIAGMYVVRPGIPAFVGRAKAGPMSLSWIGRDGKAILGKVVVTGEGKAFSAGGDLDWVAGQLPDVDLVLNATSLGLKPNDPLPFDETRFSLRQAGAVYDMIYRPAETPLLKAAKAAGCRTANGLGMLLYQGAKALELWSGQTAPVDIMRRALERNVYG